MKPLELFFEIYPNFWRERNYVQNSWLDPFLQLLRVESWLTSLTPLQAERQMGIICSLLNNNE